MVGWSVSSVLAQLREARDGTFEIFIAWEPQPKAAYRAVAFDSTEKRYNLDGSGTGCGRFAMSGYRYTDGPLDYGAVTAVGFEVLTPEGWLIQSRRAFEEAQAQGIETLPLPVAGASLPFSLTAHDGEHLQASQFLGHVLLIDCWSSWCNPCLQKMPALKDRYQRWHDRGLDIIGVNYDYQEDRFLGLIRDLDLTWPQVIVPPEQEARRLWYHSSSVNALPHFILVGRDGRVVADPGDPARMFALLDSLMAQQEER
jgi:thiol-disulfide isomerase/thioredoxin